MPPDLHHSAPSVPARWRRWARNYGTALMLAVGTIGAMPGKQPREPIPYVRTVPRGTTGGFDPRERAVDFLLTMPLSSARPRSVDEWLGRSQN